MPTKQYVLTPSESMVLKAIQTSTSTLLAQLAAELRLTPGMLRKIVRRLQSKGLIELERALADQAYFVGAVNLTETGRHVRQLLRMKTRASRRRFAQLWHGPAFIFRRKRLHEQVLIQPNDDFDAEEEMPHDEPTMSNPTLVVNR